MSSHNSQVQPRPARAAQCPAMSKTPAASAISATTVMAIRKMRTGPTRIARSASTGQEVPVIALSCPAMGWATTLSVPTRVANRFGLIEAELPSLLMRLNATIQASPNVPAALETVAKTLRSDGPLRTWTLELASRMHSEGYGAMDSIRESAAGISTSLSIAADLIGRMWTTGGEGYSKAFGAAADNLESVLDARVLAPKVGAHRAP